MKPTNQIILLFMLLVGHLPTIMAQNESKINQRFEIGLDFARFNRDWIYHNDWSSPKDNKEYFFDVIPSLYARIPFEKYSLRLKLEYSQADYKLKSNIYNIDNYQNVIGNFKNGRIFIGYEKNFINSEKFKAYGFADLGFSLFNYKGNSYGIVGGDADSDFDFNIYGLGLAIQPGFGIKYQVFQNIYINLESSVYLEKGFKTKDNWQVYSENKFIPRPLGLLGLSYLFHKR